MQTPTSRLPAVLDGPQSEFPILSCASRMSRRCRVAMDVHGHAMSAWRMSFAARRLEFLPRQSTSGKNVETCGCRRARCRFVSSSIKLSPESSVGVPQLYLFALVSGRKKTSGASFGTLKAVADCESELNLENVEGFSRKCFSRVLILVPSAGWSERS